MRIIKKQTTNNELKKINKYIKLCLWYYPYSSIEEIKNDIEKTFKILFHYEINWNKFRIKAKIEKGDHKPTKLKLVTLISVQLERK